MLHKDLRPRGGVGAVSRATGAAMLSGMVAVGLLAGCGSSSGGSSPAETSDTSSPAITSSAPAPSDSATSASASGPTVEQLTSVLLSADEVNATAKATFTAGPISPDDNSSSGCAALDAFQKAAKGSETAKAGRTFNTAGGNLTAENDLSYVPGKAASLFTQLKDAAASCPTLTVSGSVRLALTKLPDPSVSGSDDSLAIQATGDANGQTVTADIFLARFGDDVLAINYGGAVAPADASDVATALLTQAAEKAQPVVKS